MIHVYHGDGKGKTTAAMGLALRALGRGRRVLVCQLLKDGTSGEVDLLARLGAEVLHDTPPVRFTRAMDEGQRAASRAEHDGHLRRCLDALRTSPQAVVVVDELMASLSNDLADEGIVRELLAEATGKAEGPELVLTGRRPPAFVLDAADYITEMRCERHPFQEGVAAREGVEF